MGKRGQQEIAGFVIIVVLVVVAAFIFMVLSLGNKKPNTDSVEVQSLLSSLVDHTTECVVGGRLPLDMGDLAESAYGLNPRCDELGKSSREYFDETIVELMERVMQIDTRFDEYSIEIYQGNVDGTLLNSFGGGCVGKETRGADIKRREVSILLRIC
jgi:hypothetical protein